MTRFCKPPLLLLFPRKNFHSCWIMVDCKSVFYVSMPCFLFALIYFLFGWAGVFECIVDIFILSIIFLLVDFIAWKMYS